MSIWISVHVQSKASVSTMTRMLLGAGLLEKVGVPGERATYYTIRNDGFERRFEVTIRQVTGFRPLAERGMALLEAEGPARTKRLRMIGAMYAFWERELPPLVEQWRQEREKLLGEDQ